MEEDTHMATYESHKVFLLRTVYTHSLLLQVLMTCCTHCGDTVASTERKLAILAQAWSRWLGHRP